MSRRAALAMAAIGQNLLWQFSREQIQRTHQPALATGQAGARDRQSPQSEDQISAGQPRRQDPRQVGSLTPRVIEKGLAELDLAGAGEEVILAHPVGKAPAGDEWIPCRLPPMRSEAVYPLGGESASEPTCSIPVAGAQIAQPGKAMEFRQPLLARLGSFPDRIRIDQRLTSKAEAALDHRGTLGGVSRPGVRRQGQRLGGTASR